MIEKEGSRVVSARLQAFQFDVELRKHKGVFLGSAYVGCCLYEGMPSSHYLFPG